jgi:hypothetical protein
MRCIVTGRRAAVVLLAVLSLHARGALAQNEARDPAVAQPSRWSADFERIDDEVRLALLTPGDPRGNWVRASLDKTDIASQATHYTAARTAMPQDKLYLASLANACLTPTLPVLPECDAVDRLADWARRDEDNGIPVILLADRSRRRGERDMMLAYLNEAADRPRFDDYWAQGALALWDYFRDSKLPYDPAARAFAALEYASELPVTWPTALQNTCVSPREPLPDAVRTACARVGDALAARASSWTGRLVGVVLSSRNPGDAQGKARSDESRANTNRLRARCEDARRNRVDGIESADPARRARDLAAIDDWIRAQARYGEVGACERLASATTRP